MSGGLIIYLILQVNILFYHIDSDNISINEFKSYIM